MTATPHHDDIDEAGEFEDFDAWRETEQAARGGGKRVKVFGRVVTLPTDLPLSFTLTLDELGESSSLDDLKRMVAAIYGDDALDHWVASGATMHDFQVLITYGSASVQGKPITLAEASRRVREASEASEAGGKAHGRKKGKGSGGGSPATGR